MAIDVSRLFSVAPIQTGQPGTLEAEPAAGTVAPLDQSQLLQDIFSSGDIQKAAQAVEEERNNPQRQQRLMELRTLEERLGGMVNQIQQFGLAPVSGYTRAMEKVFNPYGPQQRQQAEMVIKSRMLDQVLPALTNVIQERRLLEQPGPMEDEMGKLVAQQVADIGERARRTQDVAKIEAAGAKLDPATKMAYIEGIKQAPTPQREVDVGRYIDMANIGSKLTPEAAAKLDMGSEELNTILRGAAQSEKDALEARASATAWSPQYKTAAMARTAVLTRAKAIQDAGPQDLEYLGDVQTRTPAGVVTKPSTRTRPRITVDEAIASAAEALGLTDRLADMGFPQAQQAEPGTPIPAGELRRKLVEAADEVIKSRSAGKPGAKPSKKPVIKPGG